MDKFIFLLVILLSILISYCSPIDNGKKIKVKPVQILCDITEIFCDEYNACLSKKSSKDTCDTIISRLRISCPNKTKFCLSKLICLPESQNCFEIADKLSNGNLTECFGGNCKKELFSLIVETSITLKSKEDDHVTKSVAQMSSTTTEGENIEDESESSSGSSSIISRLPTETSKTQTTNNQINTQTTFISASESAATRQQITTSASTLSFQDLTTETSKTQTTNNQINTQTTFISASESAVTRQQITTSASTLSSQDLTTETSKTQTTNNQINTQTTFISASESAATRQQITTSASTLLSQDLTTVTSKSQTSDTTKNNLINTKTSFNFPTDSATIKSIPATAVTTTAAIATSQGSLPSRTVTAMYNTDLVGGTIDVSNSTINISSQELIEQERNIRGMNNVIDESFSPTIQQELKLTGVTRSRPKFPTHGPKSFLQGKKIDEPSNGKSDYVLLHFVTVGANDTPSALLDNLPENTVSIKVTEIINQPNVGDWYIKNETTETLVSKINGDILLSQSTSILLKNSQLSGVAQLDLEIKTDRQIFQINLVKIVLPQSLTDEMNLTLEMTDFSFNIDENPVWIQITDLFNLDFLDNFRDLKQDVDEIFDKLPDSNEKQVQQKIFQRKLSNLQSELGLCLTPIANPTIVGSVQAENTGNQTITSISLKDGDTLCVLKEKYRVRFLFNNGSSGFQQIVARPWNGDYFPTHDIHQEIRFKIEIYSEKFRASNLAKPLKIFSTNLKFPDVPYMLSESDSMQLASNTISAQFFSQPSTDSFLGMAVISAGTGNYGRWQYFNEIWSDFPVSLQKGWEQFNSNLKTRLMGKFEPFNVTDLKDTISSIDAFLLDGSIKIRFHPSADKAFWSNSEAVKETIFAFLAWNPLKLSTNNTSGAMVQLDLPLCVKCTDMQISKHGIVFNSERFGCDNVLSSMKTYDDCNVCGGSNQCYDCQKVPHGKAKWTCGICSEFGDSLKDCRGVCNGTAQLFSDGRCIDPTKDSKGCDGDYMSLAYMNECGFCVGGLLNRSLSYGKDQCGTCNGTDSCLGCDGIPHSGKLLDLCMRCMNASDSGFNQGCGVKFGSISTNILNNQNQTVTLEVSGINENSAVVCVLESTDDSRKNFTLITSKPQRKEINKDDFVYAIFYNSCQPGQYSLLCTIDGTKVKFNETVFVYDYSAFQITSVFPNTVTLDDAPWDRKIKISGTFPAEVAKDPFCLDGTSFVPPNVYQITLFTSTEVSCDLSRLDKSSLMSMRVIPRNEMLAQIVDNQKPIEVKVYAKSPKLVSANFGSSLLDITVYFDTNVQGPTTCDKIFDDSVLANFGAQPVCSFSANELRVSFGNKATLNINNKISLKSNSIYQANAQFPNYTSSSSSVQLEEPKQKVLPQITIDQIQRASHCSDAVIVSVKKITGDGSRTVAYNWQLQSVDGTSDDQFQSGLRGFLKSQTDSQIVMPKSMFDSINPVTFSLTVIGCNFLNYCSPPTQTQVVIEAIEETLESEIYGLEPPIRSSQKLNMYAVTSLKYCNSAEILKDGVKYLWEIIHNSTGETTVLPKYGNSFSVPKMTFKPGQIVQVLLIAAYLNQNIGKNITTSESRIVLFESEPLWIRLGALNRKIGIGQTMTIDASMSLDPNRKDNTTLQHTWTCLKVDHQSMVNGSTPQGSPCYVNNNGTTVLLEQMLLTDQTILTIPPNVLVPGIYNFTDTVHSENLVAKETVTVAYGMNNSVPIEMVPLAERRPNVDNALNLKWNVIASPNATIQMDFIETEGFGKVDMPSAVKLKCKHTVTSKSNDSSYTFALTLPAKGSTFYSDWRGLQHGTYYKIKLTVNSSGNMGECEHVFQTNTPPSLGNFELISNDTFVTALTTVATLSASSGWTDDIVDLPLSYSFGVRAHYDDGTFKELWFPASSNDHMEIQFPSAVNAHPICGRVGYQVMVKVCDFYGSCTSKITPDGPFQVLPPANLTSSVEILLKDIDSATASGKLLLAYQKVHLLRAEMCDSISNDVANIGLSVAYDIMTNINDTIDKDEMMNGLKQTNDLLLSPKILADDNLVKKYSSLIRAVSKTFGLFPKQNLTNRKKRSVDDSSSTNVMDYASALQLMAAYELILKHSVDANTVVLYLEATEELMSELCKGRDPTMEPTMVQASNIPNPVGGLRSLTIELEPNITNEQIDGPLFPNDYPFMLLISQNFQKKYQSWQCNKKKTTCNSVCLSMAEYNTGANFQPFTLHFTSINNTTPLSKLYYVQFADPISGDPFSLNRNDFYSVWLPTNVSSTNLYQCKMFINSTWFDSLCNVSDTKSNSTQNFVLCSCTNFGYISVFEAPLPPLPGISSNQPANISFTINGSTFNKTYLQLLSVNVNVSMRRFVEPKFNVNGQKIVSFILKPPIVADRQETNLIVFKLNQTLNSTKSNSFDSVPNTLTALPIKRTLNGDNMARNVTITFINTYDSALKNDSLSDRLISGLTNQIINFVEIKSKRIVFATLTSISSKTVFNFVVQPPTTGSKERNAETASFYLKDQIFYGDQFLTDLDGVSIDIEYDGFTIVQTENLPAVQEPYDSTPTIVGSVIGSIFLIVVIIVIALVVVKQKGRVEKVSPNSSPPHSGNLLNSNRSSAQTNLLVRRVSITEDPPNVVPNRRY